ncbi:MAG TPA: FtsX-like permease family protein [Bryobacteraceae bacterium]|nr:FtsX-like permease family protein [Bryobacteraceae bacterium]
MLRHFPLIVRNTFRNKRRSVLTVLSTAASLSLLGFLLAIYNMFYFEPSSADQALRLITRNRISLANPLPISYQPRIAAVPNVTETIIFQWFGGTYKDNRDPNNFFGRFAVEPEKLWKIYPEYKTPEDQRQAFLQERTACLMGKKLMKRLNLQLGDRITVVGDIFPVTLTFVIKAVYESERDNENMIFHFKYLNESLPANRRDTVGMFVLRMAKPEDAPQIAQDVDSMFRNATQQTKTETERAFELSFLSFMGNVKAFLFAICAAITFTVLLVSGNTMAMSVRERVKEVGILKTLGFTNGTILSLLLGESVLIAIVGGAVGLGLTVLFCGALRNAPSTFADMGRLMTPPWVLGTAMVIAVVVGLVSSVIPALSASRRNIIDAMRVTD